MSYCDRDVEKMARNVRRTFGTLERTSHAANEKIGKIWKNYSAQDGQWRNIRCFASSLSGSCPTLNVVLKVLSRKRYSFTNSIIRISSTEWSPYRRTTFVVNERALSRLSHLCKTVCFQLKPSELFTLLSGTISINVVTLLCGFR